ncbi:MAG: TraB/GumN family protein [Cytophagaceae bacterium]|nr:TraB/GumN family protein [Cytophagaceae bacterium]
MKGILFSFFILFTFLFSHTTQAQKQRDHYGLLWKISGNGLSKPSYLFGTMHLSDKRVFDLSDSVIAKIQECEGFALEVAPDSIVQFIAAFMLNATEDTITQDFRKDLTASEYATLKQKLLEETTLDLDQIKDKSPEQIARLLNSPTLTKNDKATFLDGYLYRIALGEKKLMHGLEKVSDQTHESKSKYKKGIEDLKEIIHAPEYKSFIDQLIQVYSEGDIYKINDIVAARDTPHLDVLHKRNQNMADRIQEISAKQTVFYAVGAAHLAGDQGIISLLKKKGFTLTLVPSSFTGQASKYKPKPIDATWKTYTFAENGYSIAMPGQPVLYPIKEKIPLTMYVYPDLATGLFYFSLSVKIPGGSSEVDMNTVTDAFLINMFKSKDAAKGFKKRSFIFKGNEAIEGEFYNAKDKMYGKVRILKKYGSLYFIMACSYKKDALKLPDSNLFFESMELIPSTDPTQQSIQTHKGTTYTSEDGAYKVNAEASLSKFMQEVPSESGSVNTYFLSGEDKEGIAYCIVYYLPPAGLMVYDDSTYLNEFASTLTENTDPGVSQIKSITFDGFPAKTLFRQDAKTGLLMNILLVLRGSRVYMVFVVGKKELLDRPTVSQFFNSFEFIPFKQSKWFSYEDKEEGVKWKIPGNVQKQIDTTYNQELPYEKSYDAIDTCSGISYAVNISFYSPYYYMPKLEFIKKLKEDYLGEGDSILVEKKTIINGLEGIEWLIQLKKSQNKKRMLFIPIDNKLIQVYTCLPQEVIQSDVANQFFSSFTLTNSKLKTRLFESKAKQLLNDLSSNDSTIQAEALGMLHYYNFQPSETTLVYTELKKHFSDDSSGYKNVRSALLSRLKVIEDDSTVPFIKALYSSLAAYPYLQVKALETLLNLKSTSSKELFTSLINNEIPSVDDIPYSLFNAIEDSLELNSKLFPEVFTLIKSTPFRYAIYRLGNTLLDSQTINKDFFIPHLAQLLAFNKEDLQLAEDFNSSYMNIWNSIPLFGHFTDQKEIVAHLISLSHHSDDLFAYEALTQLIKRKITVDPNVLLHFAAQNKYRSNLYLLLKESDQLKLFPVKWLKQEYFAESGMYDYMGGYEDEFYYEKLELINSKIITYQGTSSRFYLFKALSEGEWYVGVSGPYALDKTQVYSEAAATNSLYEPLKSKSTNAHYEELLKETKD